MSARKWLSGLVVLVALGVLVAGTLTGCRSTCCRSAGDSPSVGVGSDGHAGHSH